MSSVNLDTRTRPGELKLMPPPIFAAYQKAELYGLHARRCVRNGLALKAGQYAKESGHWGLVVARYLDSLRCRG